jgi:lambda family phage portal protein
VSLAVATPAAAPPLAAFLGFDPRLEASAQAASSVATPAAPPVLAPAGVDPGGSGDGIVKVSIHRRTGQGGEMAMGAFEAADVYDKSLALWGAPVMSADLSIIPDKEMIDGRVADQIRNDAYISGGATLRKDNIVGAHFMPNARPATGYLKRKLGKTFDDAWEQEFQEEVEELFDLVAESPDNLLDASGASTLTGLVRLGVGVEIAAGEMLAAAEWDRDRASRGEFATMIQMLDLARLSTDPKSAMDKAVVAGIRQDRNGRPLAYQIRTQHPNDIRWDFTMPEWKEVEARKPWGRQQIIHIKEQMLPGQTRGISELASALKVSRIGHKTRDINLQRLAAQALYAAAITSDMPTEQLFASLGGETTAERITNTVTQYAEGFLGSVASYAGSARNLHVDGVKIPHLFPGTKLELMSPGKDAFPIAEWEQSLLRYIAAAMGVSYEQLSRDYTNTNYSSARAAITETWKYMQAKKKVVADRFASIIWRLFLEEAINQNHLSTLPKSKAGLFYSGNRLNLAFEAVSKVDWIGASRGQIDELKETQAAIARIDAGISTREDELARLGKDWRKVFRQLEREAILAKSCKLIFITGKASAVAGANSNDDDANDESENRKKAA